MLILLFVIHVLIALALIGVVMLQKSEGGALGMGGGGMSGFMTGRSTANLLTRTTAILAALFFATSILLVTLSNYTRAPRSIVDEGGTPPTSPLAPGSPFLPGTSGPAAPGPATPGPSSPTPAAPSPAAPAQPAPAPGPSAPLAR
jgi:preprotein translocase subunit SecG